jgi:3-methyl-2-oxobutanoate hydroxymethyltransferase
MKSERVTTWTIRRKKEQAQRLVMVTAYDATFARLADASGADMILVGDSLGHVIQGHDSTIPVTLDQMVYHCQCVDRGAKRALVVGDLPFGTYQASVEEGIRSSERLLKEGRCQAVKLEGGLHHAPLISRLAQNGIPVMGHLGLTPQSVHALGGYRVQGRTDDAAARILEEALGLEAAGAFALVLECVPASVAATITRALRIPTIGIGAGPDCDGQVLVMHDLLGLNPDFKPRFVKRYGDLHQQALAAFEAFAAEVRAGEFPQAEHSF